MRNQRLKAVFLEALSEEWTFRERRQHKQLRRRRNHQALQIMVNKTHGKVQTWRLNSSSIFRNNKPSSNKNNNNNLFICSKWWPTCLHNNSRLCKLSWWICSSNRPCSSQPCLWNSNSNSPSSKKLVSHLKKGRGKTTKIWWWQLISNNSSDLCKQITKTSKWTLWTWIKWTPCCCNNRWSIKCNIGNPTTTTNTTVNPKTRKINTRNKPMRKPTKKTRRNR